MQSKFKVFAPFWELPLSTVSGPNAKRKQTHSTSRMSTQEDHYIYLAIRRGFPFSRMTINDLISPIHFAVIRVFPS